ncbi:lipase chaperone [Marinobacter sp. JSM 1782161]|uniref:lipase chaperone n=1 Tax=Marinobacter sp. JSM 1782161 TaxID=2685906 RepID=UPI001403D8B1|nr:lipase chaperone [Marinobacter sp. JSM 1782161]
MSHSDGRPNPRRAALLGTTLLLLVAGSVWFWPEPSPKPSAHASGSELPAEQHEASPIPQPKPGKPLPVAKGRRDDGMSGEPVADIPFTVDGVFQLVQAMRLDDTGNLVPDNNARQALERIFHNGALMLSEQQLGHLAELIRAGLPGPAGEQTATLASDYYRFLEARRTLAAPNGADGRSPTSPEQRYRGLQQLRVSQLGEELANQLFRASDAHFEYMLAARRLQANPDLNLEEKLKRSKALNNTLQTDLIEVDNWPQRRTRYLEQKRLILDAALPDEDKQRQIDDLFTDTFGADERQVLAPLNLNHL